MMRRRMTPWAVLAPLIVAAPLMLHAAATNANFTADLSQGQVEILLRAEPAMVRMDRDLIVTIHVSAPDGLKVTLPDLRDRFSGFKVAENFAREPVSANGVTAFEQRWRLVPDLLRTYRLAPFAVEVREPRAVVVVDRRDGDGGEDGAGVEDRRAGGVGLADRDALVVAELEAGLLAGQDGRDAVDREDDHAPLLLRSSALRQRVKRRSLALTPW